LVFVYFFRTPEIIASLGFAILLSDAVMEKHVKQSAMNHVTIHVRHFVHGDA